MKLALLLLVACGEPAYFRTHVATHSSSIAIAGDRLYVVNADADSVSAIDTTSRSLVREISLGTPANGEAFAPSVMPRALAVYANALYVTGERANKLFAIDLTTQQIRSVVVGSEPIGVLVSQDGRTVYVACSQDDAIITLDTATLTVTAQTHVHSPWALAWSSTGELLVSHLLSPTIDVLGGAAWTIPTIALRGNDRRLPHGEARGFYDLAPRPQTSEVWIPHMLLGTDTAQPALDFESTAFPAISLFANGTYRRTLSVDVEDIARTDGSFGDIVSGPHAIAFTSDGATALVVDTNSEDVLAIDAASEVETSLLRPLPGHMPEGIAISEDDRVAYIDERNTHDVAIVRIDHGQLSNVGVIPRLRADPMPPDLRLGQHLFFSANSDEYPVTRNHWVACATCHLEGRSDAVTWKFAQGHRDTPSNAGGTRGTGFLFRTADRTRVQDYWQTINVEQGGRFDPIAQADLLDALAAFVDRGIPAPIPPTTNPALVARGRVLFATACANCHSGPRFTDSGAGNPNLALGGTLLLHDVGTCDPDDFAHADRDGNPREKCMFDTPSLTGIASSAPYFHDGRAATLFEVFTAQHGGDVAAADRTAIVEYMRSL